MASFIKSGRRFLLGAAVDDAGRLAPTCLPRRRRPPFFIIGSRLVIAAALPLALGISGDISLVVFTSLAVLRK
jgi:hypothetical protein